MREDFEIISVLGPLGSGKTTTLNHLIERVPLGESYAVVVNDVGENNIDAQRIWDHPANRSEKIIPLTAGCIGCSDVTQFREALERVHDSGINVLFIEPTGIAPGTEITDVVRSSGFDLSILTLANARTIERDLKWQVLPSQLSVADIVGITHIPDGRNEAEVMSEVLDQLPPLADDVAVELIKPGDADYFGILAQLRGMDRQLNLGRRITSLTASHYHQDEREHPHEHDHGISAKSFQLKTDVSIQQIERLLMPLTVEGESPLLRAKGVVGGVRFDVVGSEWAIQPDSSGLQTMNVIFGGRMPTVFQKDVKEITDSVERTYVGGDKKAIVKSISEMPIADRTEIAMQRVSQYPHPVSSMHGELIPDCEADEGYEIAFWGNTDDMSEDLKRKTMDMYISFRLAGLHELIHHPDSLVNVQEKGSYWMRRYGATLGYNGYHLAKYINEDQLAEIRQNNPAEMLYVGLMDIDTLTFDEGRAEEKPEFVATVMRAALKNGDIVAGQIAHLRQHVLHLSAGNEDFANRWSVAL